MEIKESSRLVALKVSWLSSRTRCFKLDSRLKWTALSRLHVITFGFCGYEFLVCPKGSGTRTIDLAVAKHGRAAATSGRQITRHFANL